MLPSIPRLRDYDIGLNNGFLPPELPLEVLPDPYYANWEVIAKNLQSLILSKRLRGVIDSLPVLSAEHLRTSSEFRRAYCLLAFFSNAYIWGGDRPAEVIPPSISIPFLAVCKELELPPVATYAGVALWNFKPIFPNEPIDILENLSTIMTFTGSLDESWFYLVSVAIEARGAPILPIMLDAIRAARNDDSARVTADLQSFAERLDELSTLLQRMYENCDPHVFYHRIRPFLAGSKNMAEAGLPNGVIFDDGSGTSEPVQYAGGSNAQSSLIQFFDLVLGIEHRPTGVGNPKDAPAANPHADAQRGEHPPPSTTVGPSHNFIMDMRQYMPGSHRRFLARVAEVANIREFVLTHPMDKSLSVAYDACLAMLRAFRDKHIQMVSRYIILKSRESRSLSPSLSLSPSERKGRGRDVAPAPTAQTPTPTTAPQRINLARIQRSDEGATGKKSPRGTGGTALIPFLKQARDETGEPAIGSWARRILTNAPGYLGGRAAPLGVVSEGKDGEVDVVGLAGIWRADDSEGGICHW